MTTAEFRNESSAAEVLRRLLLAVIVLGMIGMFSELVLLEHYEDSWQLVPLFFLAVAFVAIAAHLMLRDSRTLYLVRAVMGMLVAAGIIGVVLHYKGSLEFQLEMDATQSRWALFVKAMHAKAPPTLAPGAMAQLGLLGLLYTYRHPALGRRELHEKRSAT